MIDLAEELNRRPLTGFVSRTARVTIASLVAVLGACGGGGGETPLAPPVATSVTASSTTSLTAVAGTGVTELPSVIVRDQRGVAMAGVQVTFAVTGGGGTITGSSVPTNASGVATVGGWRLGTVPGSNSLTASTSGLTPVSFTATGTPGSALVFAGVSAGGSHTCGRTIGGAAYCWGNNFFNQVGVASSPSSSAMPFPVPVEGGLTFEAVSAGVYHSCGVTTGGSAYCWGRNAAGELGNGSTSSLGTAVPVPVSGGLRFTVISAGLDLSAPNAAAAHSCGLTTTGAAYCWGGNSRGQLGNSSTTTSSVPVPVAGGLNFVTVSAGDGFTCGLTTSGAAYCWGAGDFGELGTGSTADAPAPAAVLGGHTFASVRAASGWACGVTVVGAAYCWGVNVSGNLGNGSTANSSVPVAVSGAINFSVVSAGGAHTCGVTTGAAVYCWGNGSFGQLGNGSTTNSSVPVLVSGGVAFSAVSTGSAHTCGFTSSGTVYCWGSNGEGELGDGTRTRRTVPTRVAGQP